MEQEEDPDVEAEFDLVLVRTPTRPVEKDRFASYVASHAPNVRVHHLPALVTQPAKIESFSSTIVHGPVDRFAGVIVTSARAVSVWAHALNVLLRDRQFDREAWLKLPYFVVGPTTRDALLLALPGIVGTTIGADAGSGSDLALRIVDYFSDGKPVLPLLYLVGDKNSDRLPRTLESRKISLTSVQVYSTCADPDLPASLLKIITQARLAVGPLRSVMWFALFSPSSAAVCLDSLRGETQLVTSENDRCAELTLSSAVVRFVAIGHTTAAYLSDYENLVVHAVAQSPTPKALLSALKSASCSTVSLPASSTASE